MRTRDECSRKWKREPVPAQSGRLFEIFECISLDETEEDRLANKAIVERNIHCLAQDLKNTEFTFIGSSPVLRGNRVVNKRDEYKADAEVDWATGEILAIGSNCINNPAIEDNEYATPVELRAATDNPEFRTSEQPSYAFWVTPLATEEQPLEAVVLSQALDNLTATFNHYNDPLADG